MNKLVSFINHHTGKGFVLVCVSISLLLGSLCYAQELPNGHRARCGDYTYILPEGLEAVDQTRPVVSINRYAPYMEELDRYAAVCNNFPKYEPGYGFYLDSSSSKGVCYAYPDIKNAPCLVVAGFDTFMNGDVRLYKLTGRENKNKPNILRFMYAIEVSPASSSEFVVITFPRCLFYDPESKERTNAVCRQYALDIVNSLTFSPLQ